MFPFSFNYCKHEADYEIAVNSGFLCAFNVSVSIFSLRFLESFLFLLPVEISSDSNLRFNSVLSATFSTLTFSKRCLYLWFASMQLFMNSLEIGMSLVLIFSYFTSSYIKFKETIDLLFLLPSTMRSFTRERFFMKFWPKINTALHAYQMSFLPASYLNKKTSRRSFSCWRMSNHF